MIESLTTSLCQAFTVMHTLAWPGVLAQQQPGQPKPVSLEQAVSIFISLGLLVGAIIILIIAAMVIKKWLGRQNLEAQVGGSGQFTMNQLRQMHAQGHLNDEEFDRAKRLLVARSKAMLVEEEDKEDKPSANRAADDDDDDADDVKGDAKDQ